MKVPQFPSIDDDFVAIADYGQLKSFNLFYFFTVFIKKGDFIILAVYFHRAILCVNFILNHFI